MQGERANRVAILAIVCVSASLGILLDWRAPGIERYTRDWLMRARGTLPAPADIAIVAIDERSTQRFGRFPWPRSVMARAIDALAVTRPKVIAIDVLYPERTTAAEDSVLAQSISHAGNVVVAAQLVEGAEAGSPSTWLLPIPDIEHAAAAVGHVNVSTESEGVARQFLAREADDSGRTIRALSVEAVRIGDETREDAIAETPQALLLGARVIPVDATRPPVALAGPVQVIRPLRIAIDYIGPTGSFAPHTYSLADVIEGQVPSDAFRGKYVLIGATAASLGDRLASPFIHQSDARGDQHGTLMPGVEVLANTLNTILRSRYYTDLEDWTRFLICAAVAGITLGLLSIAGGKHEMLKELGVLAGTAGGVVLVSCLAFDYALIYPPLAPALVSFASSGVLGLLKRSLVTSSRLDASIAEIARAGDVLAPAGSPAAVAESIARMSKASAVAILSKNGDGQYRFLAGYGSSSVRVPDGRGHISPDFDRTLVRSLFSFSNGSQDQHEFLKLPFANGLVAIAQERGNLLTPETPLICSAIAASACQNAAQESGQDTAGRRWPHGLEWKARALGNLNSRIIERAKFADMALRSVEDGLIIAATDGRITFANRRAIEILGLPGEALIGRDLFQRLREAGGLDLDKDREPLARLLLDRGTIEGEIAIRNMRLRYYNLRIAAVAPPENGVVLGIVASLSDITRQRELQQVKNDVVALVSHEMRTPLTAIQGMSELLAEFEVDPRRQREMNRAINDEAKRLTRMITEYLDIARLESGATVLRRSAMRVETLIDRTLLLLDPIAAQRRIDLVKRFDPDLPSLLADPELLSRAIANLVSNAIKHSPPGLEIQIAASSDAENVFVRVIDRGCGIPEACLGRLFEKFYRVPRVQDADTPGTGLGLALVREVAELHGGSVAVSSIVNKGSTFVLRIPYSKEPGYGQSGPHSGGG